MSLTTAQETVAVDFLWEFRKKPIQGADGWVPEQALEKLKGQDPTVYQWVVECLHASEDPQLLSRLAARNRLDPDLRAHYRFLQLFPRRREFQEVWKAEDLQSPPENVAVKIFSRRLVEQDPTRFECLPRLKGLHLPNLVRVRDAGPTADGGYYLVMDWLEGERLDRIMDRLRRNESADRPPCDTFVHWMAGLAHGVHAAYATAHLILTDIKPENIIVTAGPEGRIPVLIDIDAVVVVPEGRTKSAPGPSEWTLGFEAPEQVGNGEIGPWTSVWSLGKVLRACLPDKKDPLQRELNQAGEATLQPEAPLSISKIPGFSGEDGKCTGLKLIAQKCSRKDPERWLCLRFRRYRDAGRFRDDLHCLASGLPLSAAPLRFHDKLGEWFDCKGSLLVRRYGLYVFLIALLAFLGSGVWKERHHRQITAILEQALADGRDYQDVLGQLPDGPERLRYRVLRLPILLKNNKRLLLARELEELTARQSEMEDSTIKALLLFKVDPALNPLEHKDELRERLKRALEGPGKLSYQDSAYAEGLALWFAGQTEEALARFDQAGPSHHRARRLQLRVRLERGEYGIARPLAARMREDFPQDPLPLLAQAMVDLISDNTSAGKGEIEYLCQVLDDLHQTVLRRYWDHVLGIHQLLLRFANTNDEVESASLVRPIHEHRVLLGKVMADSMLETAVLELPLASRLLATADGLFDAFGLIARLGGSQVSRLIKASRQNPEALLVRIAAALELEAALAADRRGDVGALERHLRNVKDLCQKAYETPTLYPSMHYQCKLVQAIGTIFLVHIAPDIPHAALDQLQALLSQILEEAHRWPADHERGLQGLVDAIAAQPTQEQSTAWHLEIESNRLLYWEKQNYLISIAKHYLRKWESIALPALGGSAVGLGAWPLGQGALLAASALIPGRTIELINHLRQVLDRADTR
jgi:serine/threonine protein kinase